EGMLRGENDGGPLVPCPDCGRKFNEESIERHLRICKKVFQQKRKQFNSAANRLGEFENANELIANAAKLEKQRNQQEEATERQPDKKVKEKEGKMTKWKAQSLAFRQAILSAKADGGDEEARKQADEISKELIAGGGKEAEDADKTKCPHCGRTFNKDAGERHIAICVKTFGNKGGRLVKGGGTGGVGSKEALGAQGAAAPQRGPAPAPPAPAPPSKAPTIGSAAARKPSLQRDRKSLGPPAGPVRAGQR
ncbi:unnamed protein product, partial [Polarella glacialis]